MKLDENERTLGPLKYILPVIVLVFSCPMMMVSTVKYPELQGAWDLRSTITFLKIIITALLFGFVFILVFRETILFYVLPAFFTLYLIYGFIRPRISRRVRHEIEEEDEEVDDPSLPK